MKMFADRSNELRIWLMAALRGRPERPHGQFLPAGRPVLLDGFRLRLLISDKSRELEGARPPARGRSAARHGARPCRRELSRPGVATRAGTTVLTRGLRGRSRGGSRWPAGHAGRRLGLGVDPWLAGL